jgi:hypothetical protein
VNNTDDVSMVSAMGSQLPTSQQVTIIVKGPDPTVVSQGAISLPEAFGAPPTAVCRESREFRDSDASPKFRGGFRVAKLSRRTSNLRDVFRDSEDETPAQTLVSDEGYFKWPRMT